jgi:uncharacterized membrane protein
LLFGATWTAAVLAAPLLESSAIYAAAGLICHQLAERTFHFGAGPVAVCARCLGLYAGGLAGLIAGEWLGVARGGTARARALVGLAAVPTAATLAAEWLLAWPVGNHARFVAALPLGAAAAYVVAAAIAADRRRSPATTR